MIFFALLWYINGKNIELLVCIYTHICIYTYIYIYTYIHTYIYFNNKPLDFKPVGIYALKLLKDNNLSECRNLYWKLNNKYVDDP